MLVMRLAGTFFVMLAVVLLYAAVREVSPHRPLAAGPRRGDPRHDDGAHEPAQPGAERRAAAARVRRDVLVARARSAPATIQACCCRSSRVSTVVDAARRGARRGRRRARRRCGPTARCDSVSWRSRGGAAADRLAARGVRADAAAVGRCSTSTSTAGSGRSAGATAAAARRRRGTSGSSGTSSSCCTPPPWASSGASGCSSGRRRRRRPMRGPPVVIAAAGAIALVVAPALG